MSFLNNFFEVTPKTPKSVEPASDVAPRTQATVKTTTFTPGENMPISESDTVTSVATYTGSATQQALEYFSNLLVEKNLPGNDYFEFIQATQDDALKAFPTEAQKYAAAFFAFKTQGLTKEKLIETAQLYQKEIDIDLASMETSFQEAFKVQVEGKLAKVEELNQKKNELLAEIDKLSGEAETLQAEAIDNENTLKANKNSFSQAAEISKQKIGKEIEKIIKHIA